EVSAEAEKRFKGSQQPQINAENTTDIVLAINHRVKKRRIAEEQRQLEQERADLERKDKFGQIICAQIFKSNSGQKRLIIDRIRVYVAKGRRVAGFDSFYDRFEEDIVLWQPGNNSQIEEFCEYLINSHEEAYAAASVSAGEAQPQGQVASVDNYVSALDSKGLASPSFPPQTLPVTQSEQEADRRKPNALLSALVAKGQA